jgi:DHA2 family multidrug resistance protein
VEQDSARQINKWIVAMTVILPTFIEIMDTSVVNVSLPHIQGSLNAGLDEVTWVLTSYMVSNAIIIPITGWLAGIFGRKRYLIFSILLFTVSSIACGAAPSLRILIIARVLQGLGGGGLQPLSQAILLESFPVEEHGLAMAVFGVGVVLAPILGPIAGGWITDTLSWRWVFYINVPIGVLAVILALMFIYDPPYIRKSIIGRIDYWGLGLIAVGIGSLQILLDKGEREDWFESHLIISLSVIAAVALTLFIIRELRSQNPVVNLRVFRDRTFAIGNLIMFTGFFCFFGSIVMLPLYLQNLMGYTAFWAGLVLGPGAIASLCIMPVAGVLIKKGVKPRGLLALGLFTLSCSLWLMSGFNLEADFVAVAWPRVVQALGLGLFFVPVAAATYVNISREEIGNATGIFNLVRNIGGSFGVAIATTVLSQRSQVHQTFLAEHITPFHHSVQEHWVALNHLIVGESSSAALAFLYREVLRQASMLAFNDAFRLYAWFTACLIPLTLLMKGASRERLSGTAEGIH